MSSEWDKIEEVATLIAVLIVSNIVSFSVNLAIMVRFHDMTK